MKPEYYRESWKAMSREEISVQMEIRTLNDRHRKMAPPRSLDLVIIMGVLKNEGSVVHSAVYNAVRAFDSFTESNDPHGEHDLGSFDLTVEGVDRRFMFKIDYYDLNLEFASPDPGDKNVTRRVMSMFDARDY